MILLQLIIILFLGLIFRQDLKYRAVSWILFPAVLLVSGWLFYSQTLSELYISSVLINLIILSILFLSLWLYVRLKLRSTLLEVIGLGDLLFLLAMGFGFAPISFISLLVCGLLFSLVVHTLRLRTEAEQTVPLAGYLSAFLALSYLAYWSGIISNLYVI